MGNGTVTPWNVLSDAVAKKVGAARDRAQAAKDKQQTTEYKAWDGILQNPNSTPEEREQALDSMKKMVPKETVPVVEAYHKVLDLVHRKKQGQQPAPGQGQGQGQGQPPKPPQSAAGPGPTAPPVNGSSSGAPPNTLPGIMSAQAKRAPADAGAAKGQEVAAQQAAEAKGREDQAQRVRDAYKSKGEKIPEWMDEALTYESATGKNVPAGFNKKPSSANAPKKPPKMIYGPGGQFRGISEPEDKESDTPGQEYNSRSEIPPDRKDLLEKWDAGEKQQKQEQAAELDKEHRKTAEMVDMMGKRMDEAVKLGDHKAALKVYNDSKKAYQDAIDRDSTMSANLRDILEAKKNGKENQQAMLSMLANHVGMTSGSQPKMRMSKAQWDEAKDSVPLLQRVEAKFDSEGYLSGVTLTQEQMDQMLELAHEKVAQLKDHVDRVKNDPDYSEALQLGKSSAVPPGMKGPKGNGNGNGNSKGTSSGGKIKVTAEDMANAH